jgi:DNA-binding XRE family transcriptional regulator
MTSYVYFIQAKGDGPIKIGFTADDPRKRMVKIQSDCPWPVSLIGTIEGSVSLEKQIHLLLARWRTQGEWFQPHPIVLAAVQEALRVGRKPTVQVQPREPKYQHPLCRYRADNNLTLKVVADRVGITHASLSRIESGRQLPSWDLACRLAKATGLHVKAFRPETYQMLFGNEAVQ